jgi:large subunit ribosomal protein L15
VNSNKSAQPKAVTVNVSVIEENFKKGAVVSPKTLFKAGLILKNGEKFPIVKVLGQGDISVAVTIVGCKVSASGQEKIEKAGGKVK